MSDLRSNASPTNSTRSAPATPAAPATPNSAASPASSATASKRPPWGLFVAVLVLIGVLSLPAPPDLPLAGHRMLAILAFAVVVWISEAVS